MVFDMTEAIAITKRIIFDIIKKPFEWAKVLPPWAKVLILCFVFALTALVGWAVWVNKDEWMRVRA